MFCYSVHSAPTASTAAEMGATTAIPSLLLRPTTAQPPPGQRKLET